MTPRRLALFSLALPLALMVAWISLHAWRSASGTAIELRVVGYDPRDLLSGHYLRYRVDYGPRGGCSPEAHRRAGDVCQCLTPGGSRRIATTFWSGSCDLRPRNCELFIRGECGSGAFRAGIERFYFPESYAPKLLSVPPDATIEVRLTRTGRAQVTAFLVDGKPVADYVRQK